MITKPKSQIHTVSEPTENSLEERMQTIMKTYETCMLISNRTKTFITLAVLRRRESTDPSIITLSYGTSFKEWCGSGGQQTSDYWQHVLTSTGSRTTIQSYCSRNKCVAARQPGWCLYVCVCVCVCLHCLVAYIVSTTFGWGWLKIWEHTLSSGSNMWGKDGSGLLYSSSLSRVYSQNK